MPGVFALTALELAQLIHGLEFFRLEAPGGDEREMIDVAVFFAGRQEICVVVAFERSAAGILADPADESAAEAGKLPQRHGRPMLDPSVGLRNRRNHT